MRKSLLSLLVVATVIATILVAGCTSSTPSSPQVASTNTSSTTASTTTTSSSSAVKASVSPSPSASASPTQAASPTPTASPTSTPQSVATSIYGDPTTFLSNPTITRNSPVSWLFAIAPPGSLPPSIPASTVTAKIDNKVIGQVTTFSGGTDNVKVVFTSAQTNSLTAGSTYTLTVSFAGYGKYQPSVGTFQITVQ